MVVSIVVVVARCLKMICEWRCEFVYIKRKFLNIKKMICFILHIRTDVQKLWINKSAKAKHIIILRHKTKKYKQVEIIEVWVFVAVVKIHSFFSVENYEYDKALHVTR